MKVYGAIKGNSEHFRSRFKEMPVWGSMFQAMSHGDQGQVQLRIPEPDKMRPYERNLSWATAQVAAGPANSSRIGLPGNCPASFFRPIRSRMVGTKLRLSYGSSITRQRGMPVWSPPSQHQHIRGDAKRVSLYFRPD